MGSQGMDGWNKCHHESREKLNFSYFVISISALEKQKNQFDDNIRMAIEYIYNWWRIYSILATVANHCSIYHQFCRTKQNKTKSKEKGRPTKPTAHNLDNVQERIQ